MLRTIRLSPLKVATGSYSLANAKRSTSNSSEYPMIEISFARRKADFLQAKLYTASVFFRDPRKWFSVSAEGYDYSEKRKIFPLKSMADTNYIAMGRACENQSDTSRYINEFTRTRTCWNHGRCYFKRVRDIFKFAVLLRGRILLEHWNAISPELRLQSDAKQFCEYSSK